MTENYTEYDCPGDGVHTFTVYETVLWFFLYCAVAVLTVAGNGLVMVVILRRKHMKTVTNYFILNLAAAEGMTGLLGIPFKFQAALLQRWDLPSFMCKLVPFVETVSMSVSVVILICIAIDRWTFVMFPRAQRISMRTAKLIIGCVWLSGVVVSVPYGMGHRMGQMPEFEEGDLENSTGVLVPSVNITRPICYPYYAGAQLWHIYNIYLTIVQYFVPVFIIGGAYLCVAYKIWMMRAPRSVRPHSLRSLRTTDFARSRKRVVKMLIIVVCMFAFCWLPLETYYVLAETYRCINNYTYINVIYFCCHWLAMSNSCLNPIIYGVFNKKFRQEYDTIGRMLCRRRQRHEWMRHGAKRIRRRRRNAFAKKTSLGLSTTSLACHSYIADELGQGTYMLEKLRSRYGSVNESNC